MLYLPELNCVLELFFLTVVNKIALIIRRRLKIYSCHPKTRLSVSVGIYDIELYVPDTETIAPKQDHLGFSGNETAFFLEKVLPKTSLIPSVDSFLK